MAKKPARRFVVSANKVRIGKDNHVFGQRSWLPHEDLRSRSGDFCTRMTAGEARKVVQKKPYLSIYELVLVETKKVKP